MVEEGENRGRCRACDRGQVSVSPQGFPSEKNRFGGRVRGFVPLFTGQVFFASRRIAFGDCFGRLTESYGKVPGQPCPPAGGVRGRDKPAWCRRFPLSDHARPECPLHDRIKHRPRACAARAGGPDVPRHHLGGLGLQLAGDEISVRRIAAADLARGDRRGRRAAAGRAGAGVPAKPEGAARGSGRGW